VEIRYGITVPTSDFCLRRKNHVTRVQSSIKDTNQRAPEILGIVEGPQMSDKPLVRFTYARRRHKGVFGEGPGGKLSQRVSLLVKGQRGRLSQHVIK